MRFAFSLALLGGLALAACSGSPSPTDGGSEDEPDGALPDGPTRDSTGCADADNDGYGPGCAAGPDCAPNDPAIHPNAAESCDGVDNDCSGSADEGCPCTEGQTRDCGVQIGACAAGQQHCEGGTWRNCVGAIEPTEESCDGALDEDCDSLVDEGCTCRDGERRPCGSDEGACQSGNQGCMAGTWATCLGAVTPTVEMCDGTHDEDCDGAVDEGCTCVNDSTQPCGMDQGVCESGVERCLDGIWGACEGATMPTEESCTGALDEDCDGTVDEGCVATRFAEGTEWSTPIGGRTDGAYRGFYAVAGGHDRDDNQFWFLFDLTGDGRPDLVVTAQGGEQFDHDTAPHWRVHPNNGAGFDAEPMIWSTPTGGRTTGTYRGFHTIAGGDDGADNQSWSTVDLTGDGLPDLVVASQGGNQFDYETTAHWRVHRNNGAGFDGEPMTWSTPTGGRTDGLYRGFHALAGGYPRADNEGWSTLDLTGDGRPDLVVSSRGGNQFDHETTAHWRVHRNNGAGFDGEPMTWSTPTGGRTDGNHRGFHALAGGYPRADNEGWSTLDLTGDDLPDLVISSRGGSQFEHDTAPHWRMHRNNGAGFDTESVTWSTPIGGRTDGLYRGFHALSGGYNRADNQFWSTLDLTGDGLPDLLVTSQAGYQFDHGTTPSWRIHRNTGTGFEAEGVTWSTPVGGRTDGTYRGFYVVAGGEDRADNQFWSTLDLTGDGRLDLLVTSQGGNQFDYDGMPYWRVYRAVP